MDGSYIIVWVNGKIIAVTKQHSSEAHRSYVFYVFTYLYMYTVHNA